jgi:tetratricopeptide (TPR) repeat protein
MLLMLMLLPLGAQAVTKAEADKSYSEGQYQQAIEQYEQLLKQGVSTAVYYNLGNAYYRVDDLTHAILNYERALLLSPSDDDVKFNLQLARSKTVDKLTPESEMFFVTWYRSVVNLMSVDAWARLALISLAVAIVLALIYLFSSPIALRKIGFFGGVLMLVIFLVSNLFAWQQKRAIQRHDEAIVMQSPCNVKSTPDASGKDLFILHEGTKVTVTDSGMKDWKEIRLSDGRKGWVDNTMIEVI